MHFGFASICLIAREVQTNLGLIAEFAPDRAVSPKSGLRALIQRRPALSNRRAVLLFRRTIIPGRGTPEFDFGSIGRFVMSQIRCENLGCSDLSTKISYGDHEPAKKIMPVLPSN